MREAVTFGSAYQLPFGVHDLLSPLRTRVTGYQPEPEARVMGRYVQGA